MLQQEVDPSANEWKEGFDDGRRGSVCADHTNLNYLDGWLYGDQERHAEEQ